MKKRERERKKKAFIHIFVRKEVEEKTLSSSLYIEEHENSKKKKQIC